ncbi:hypothetical protein ACS0TY_008212 [Phlomoides rotata]
MFAAQLLRILQTIPSDVESETCVGDSAEQDMTMKENQNETLDGSKSYGREVDPLEFDSKEVYEINGLSPFEQKGKDESWNRKFVDDLSTRESEREDFQNGLLYCLSSPEHEHTVHLNETKPIDSRSPFIAASNPFEKDSNYFSDEIVLECEHPELIVCYREVNYHVVKDICIDNGMPLNREFLTYSSKDDHFDHSLLQPLNDDSQCKATEAVPEEFLISDELAAISQENTKGIIANEHGSEEEEECHNILLSQGRPKSPDKDCDKEDSLQKGETNFTASSKTGASKESFVDNSLPIQEFGTRSFLRSFLNSLDDGALPDQILSGKVVSVVCAPSSAETRPKDDIQATNLHYNSKVETGSITFNFNSPEPVFTNVGHGNVKEPSVGPRDSLGYKDTTSDHQTLDIASFRRYDEGESSFSASGVINYSGPIAFSGSLSDGSASCATSGRSFAFPILQNEWNSSPVRMTKRDGRHFRKHRGWRSGLLCCRF